MSVPEFFRFIRPSLEILKDRQPRHWREIETIVADPLQLSPQDRSELEPSGRRTRLSGRTQWALTYMRQAQLLEPTGRGVNRITKRGLGYLRTAPDVITARDLMQFAEFAAFQ